MGGADNALNCIVATGAYIIEVLVTLTDNSFPNESLCCHSLVALRGWSVRKGTAENILRVPIGCHALPADEESGCNAPVL